jgi:hypothetical protein
MVKMEAVSRRAVPGEPELVALVEDALRVAPQSAWGLPLVWRAERQSRPMYLGRVARSQGDEGPVEVFGVRYDLSDALVGDESLGEGWLVEYVLVSTTPPDQRRVLRLIQRQGVTYAASDDDADHVDAIDVADVRAHSLRQPPRWKAKAAQWPTHRGRPMRFLGQIRVPDIAPMREHFIWDVDIFIFDTEDGAHRFQIVQQDLAEQPAEEHYADEERLSN